MRVVFSESVKHESERTEFLDHKDMTVLPHVKKSL